MTVESSLADATKKMKGALGVLHEELSAIRTGRATPSLLNRVTVDYYGTQTPMSQLAQFSVPEPRMLVVQPYDKSVMGAFANGPASRLIGRLAIVMLVLLNGALLVSLLR